MSLTRWKPSRSAWDRAAATHLLRRAGFGARPGEVERFVQQGFEASVAEVLERDAHEEWLLNGVQAILPAGDEEKLAAWWMSLILAGGAPLRERVTTVHFFDPCELLRPDARSEIRPEHRRRMRGGGWELAKPEE